MTASRLSTALDTGAIELPESGRIAVWRPRSDYDLSPLPKGRVQIIQGFRPDYDAWNAKGFDVVAEPVGEYPLALLCVPRAKDEARAMIAEAARRGARLIVVDGQKTDGIESLLKACRARATIGSVISHSHGKLFTIEGHDGFADWAAAPAEGPEGFVTVPGVFSADRVDHGSALLAAALPKTLGRRVADLGAGWGYLSAECLKRPDLEMLHVIEADHAAISCARANLDDRRAVFHWADAAVLRLPGLIDTVVSNPPFHVGRKADPGLGRAFIAAAARALTTRGALWLVANRHLPYEAELQRHFLEVREIGGDAGFKVIRAARPKGDDRTRR